MSPVIDNFDLFIDLSGTDLLDREIVAHLALFRRRSGLVADGRRITLARPNGRIGHHQDVSCPQGSPGEVLAQALSAAGAARRGLLVVQGAWIPPNEAAAPLVGYQDADPMIGTLQPRFATARDDRIVGLPGPQGAMPVMLSRAVAPYLPETVLTPELVAPLLLISPRGVLAAEAVPAGPFDEALAQVLVALRRRGFRNLVCNRCVVPVPFDEALVYPLPAIAVGPHDHHWRQDTLRARAWLAAMPEVALEAVLAASIAADGRVRILLDCRGAQDFHNGTGIAILGYLDGLEQVGAPKLDITVLATLAAARFHKLEARYPHFRIQVDAPRGCFLAAIRLDQPWDVNTVSELHSHALFLAFNMLDTIAWDIIYSAPDRLDRSWRVLAQMADAFLFISHYTRDRFVFRFRPDAAIPLVVTHLSLSGAEATCDVLRSEPAPAPYILVFGNTYDHKGLKHAVATLADAFPYTRIVVIGAATSRSPLVTALNSGRLSDAEITTFMAEASVVVFPSHYEGFGLPVVHGLAHGRTVVVRESALWQEIADHADLPGRLVPFADEFGLVAAVGATLHGRPPAGLPFGAAIPAGGSGPSWRDCATRITDLVGSLVAVNGSGRWLQRQAMLQCAAAPEEE
ncbi:glycosyltransferase [Humitalea sp. 24SJ18S-53]|uniref:glycosyltransferase n=1 Tax=Humitalea sp. 24SJ18S-53 TaxID=3422307 RepID=UPI003D67D9B8